MPVTLWEQGEQNLPEMVRRRYRIAQSNMATTVEKWRALLQMYSTGDKDNLDTLTDDRGRKYQSDQNIANVSSSVMFNAVETIAPRLMGNFDPEGWFTAQPRPNSKTTVASARYVEDKIKQQLEDPEATINNTLLVAAKQAVKIGSAVLSVGWDVQHGINYRKEITGVAADGTIIEKFVPHKGITYRGPKVRLVPWFNFFPDPKGKHDINRCLYVIEEVIVSFKDLEQGVKMGVYEQDQVDIVKEMYAKETISDPKTDGDHLYSSHDPYRNEVRMTNYYEDDRYIYMVVPWGNGAGTILNPKSQDNPFGHKTKPYVKLAVDVDETKVFPMGVLESVRDEQSIKTTFLNMALDAGTMSFRPMRLISKSLGIDPKELAEFIPNKPIEVDDDPRFTDMNGRIADRYMEIKPDPNGFMTLLPLFLQMIDKEANEKTGVNAALSGQAGVGHTKTYRGIAQLTQTAEVRIAIDSQIMAMGATRLLEMIHSMNQQFGDITEDQYGQYNWKVFQNAVVDRNIRLQTLQQMLPIIGAVGGNVNEALRRILREGGISGIDAILPNDGSMEKNQNQEAQGQALQMMLQGQGGGGAQAI